ncbi:hypothetical protein FB570_11128 [Streptomyces sp. T12]|nr:hypothetical protein FB570_11128 [Streptomyces sp. T12]
MPDHHQSFNGYGYGYANNTPTTVADPSGLGVPECYTGEISCTGGRPDTAAEIKAKGKKPNKSGTSTAGTSYVNKDGRSGSAPPGAARYSRYMEQILFTNH